MANMGYCRFRNTILDLGDCLEALNNGESLSEEEHRACTLMFQEFIGFLCNEGIIEDEDGELDERLEKFLSQISID